MPSPQNTSEMAPVIAIPTPRRRLSLFTAFDTFGDDLNMAFQSNKPKSPTSPEADRTLEGPPPPPPSPVSFKKAQDYFGNGATKKQK